MARTKKGKKAAELEAIVAKIKANAPPAANSAKLNKAIEELSSFKESYVKKAIKTIRDRTKSKKKIRELKTKVTAQNATGGNGNAFTGSHKKARRARHGKKGKAAVQQAPVTSANQLPLGGTAAGPSVPSAPAIAGSQAASHAADAGGKKRKRDGDDDANTANELQTAPAMDAGSAGGKKQKKGSYRDVDAAPSTKTPKLEYGKQEVILGKPSIPKLDVTMVDVSTIDVSSASVKVEQGEYEEDVVL